MIKSFIINKMQKGRIENSKEKTFVFNDEKKNLNQNI